MTIKDPLAYHITEQMKKRAQIVGSLIQIFELKAQRLFEMYGDNTHTTERFYQEVCNEFRIPLEKMGITIKIHELSLNNDVFVYWKDKDLGKLTYNYDRNSRWHNKLGAFHICRSTNKLFGLQGEHLIGLKELLLQVGPEQRMDKETADALNKELTSLEKWIITMA